MWGINFCLLKITEAPVHMSLFICLFFCVCVCNRVLVCKTMYLYVYVCVCLCIDIGDRDMGIFFSGFNAFELTI